MEQFFQLRFVANFRLEVWNCGGFLHIRGGGWRWKTEEGVRHGEGGWSATSHPPLTSIVLCGTVSCAESGQGRRLNSKAI